MSPAGWEIESTHWQKQRLVAGVDEAGRGPLAGPVVAAAVIFPAGCDIGWLDDSKRLTPKQREEYFAAIGREATAWAWAQAAPELIDRIGILPATFRAMGEALAALGSRPDYVLVDGNIWPRGWEMGGEAVVKGDGRSASIAAASIVAKVVRDRLMREFHAQFPHYGFDHNKGYYTELHVRAIEEHGPCPIHRRSFRPVCELRLPFD